MKFIRDLKLSDFLRYPIGFLSNSFKKYSGFYQGDTKIFSKFVVNSTVKENHHGVIVL
jgi:hypothetical protein